MPLTRDHSTSFPMRRMLKTALFSVALLCSACDGIFEGAACTDAGCQSGLELRVTIADDSVSLGDYSVEITTASNEQLTCTFTLVQTGSDCASGSCIENRSCDQFSTEADHYSPIVEYYLPEDKILIFYPVLEDELTISINKDDALLSNLRTEPIYETNRPNGPRCDPVCRNSTIDIDLNGE